MVSVQHRLVGGLKLTHRPTPQKWKKALNCDVYFDFYFLVALIIFPSLKIKTAGMYDDGFIVIIKQNYDNV